MRVVRLSVVIFHVTCIHVSLTGEIIPVGTIVKATVHSPLQHRVVLHVTLWLHRAVRTARRSIHCSRSNGAMHSSLLYFLGWQPQPKLRLREG